MSAPPPDSPSRASAPVRCYACASRQDPSGPACAKCGAVFRGLCGCGAEHSVYDRACPACARALTPKRLPRAKHPGVRAVRWGLLAVVLAAGAGVWLRGRRELPAYAVKTQADRDYAAGRYQEAAQAYRSVTERSPRDAQAWLNLAICYQRLGMGAQAALPAARTAAQIAPQFYPARFTLATLERDAGNVVAALEHAQAAAALPDALPAAKVLVAHLLVSLPTPDLHGAVEAIRGAARDGRLSLETRILLAECYLWIYGSLPPSGYPTEVAAALQQARDALPETLSPDDEVRRPEVAAQHARLLLAVGDASEAYAVTDRVLTAPAATLAPSVRAQLLVLRARAVLQWRGQREDPAADMASALELAPDAATCREIVVPLAAFGWADLAEQVLARRAERPAAGAAVWAALARVRLARGESAGALAAAEEALRAGPADASMLVLRGDALAAEGDLERARADYRAARERAAAWVVPRVREAELALAPRLADARGAGARAALAELDALTPAERAGASVRTAMARLALAAGDPARAATEAAAATDAAPADPGAWLLLADAALAQDGPEAASRAAAALTRARRLRPLDADIAAAEIRALLRANDAPAALAAASRFLDVVPDAPEVLRLRARVALELGRWADAAQDFRRLRAAAPADVDLAVAAAEAEHRAGDPGAARRILDGIDPGGRRDVAELVDVLKLRVEGLTPDRVAAHVRAGGTTAALARALLLSLRLTEAHVVAREVLARSPGDPAATEVLVHAACDGGLGDEMLAEASRAVDALSPEAPEWLAPVLRARLFAEARRWTDAQGVLAPVRDRLPQLAVPVFVSGWVATQTGDVEGGVATVRRSLSLPGAPVSLPRAVGDVLAWAAVASRDVARAESLARAALALDGDNVVAAARGSEALRARGDFESAAGFAERGLASPRATREQLLDLRLRAAACHVAAGSSATALDHLQQAARLDPDSHLVHVVRGQALLAAGDDAGAEAALTAARQAAPDDPVVEAQFVGLDVHRGRADDAAARAERWCAAHPQDDIVAACAVRALLSQGHAAAAAGLLRSRLAARPTSEHVADALVDALLRAGRGDEALAAARQFAAGPGGGRPEAQLVVARAAVARRETAPQAIEVARKVRSIPALPPRPAAMTWAIEAHALLRTGAVAEAASAAQAGLGVLAAEGAGAYRDVELTLQQAAGHCALASDDATAAALAFGRCAEIAPRGVDDLNNLAWALARVPGSGASALHHARRAVELRPGDPNLWATRGVAAQAAEDPTDAEASYRRCLFLHDADPARDPDGRARAAIRLARLLGAGGRKADARAAAAEVARYVPAPSEPLRREAAGLASEP